MQQPGLSNSCKLSQVMHGSQLPCCMMHTLRCLDCATCCFVQAFFPCNSPSNYPLDLVIRSPSIYFLLCEALVCPKLQMHSAGYQHYHVALSRFYACSDAMIAAVLIGINPCRAFAAGHILPFYMDHSCIAAACATNAYHPFVANPPCMQKHQPMLQ